MPLLVLCVLLTVLQQAQTQTGDPPEQMDIADLWRAIRQKPAETGPRASDNREPMLAIAPLIGSNPSTGATFGVAGQLAFFVGDAPETSLSSGIASLSVSTKKQVLLTARFGVFGNANRWLLQSDNRLHHTSQDTYGLGASTPSDAAFDVKYNFIRFHETAYWRVRDHLFAGAGLLFDSHTNIHPATEGDPAWATSPYVTYTEAHGFSLDSQHTTGVSVNVLVDTRDNPIDARRGWYADGAYRFGDWQSVHVDVRRYASLDREGRHRLAGWFFGDLVTYGAPPYFDLPTTVMDTYGRSARGYREGRYRGERLLYGEVEYRGTLTRNGLLGMVLFANATTLTNLTAGESLFDHVAPAGGGGLRVLFNKRSRTNLCIDVAWGRDSHGVYFGIQDAF